MHYLLRTYDEHTHASQHYRAVLLVSQNFNSVIDLQLYSRFAKGYSHNVLHCAYPLCTVSHNSKTLQVCVCMCVKHITAKKCSKHTLKIPPRQFEDKCQFPNEKIHSHTLISHSQRIHEVTMWTQALIMVHTPVMIQLEET